MNKEVHYEGWLIKSPPSKRIWRSRWRRRWFTLKQGEIPEQFCLEYYTDRNCRKLKGIIDLDQCEQVDCGLRLENRKQKFQFMFDIKTPKRTYYLAADSAEYMRDWVNCICQVCHLHDTNHSMDDCDRTCGNIKPHSTTSLNITPPVANTQDKEINNHKQLLLFPSTYRVKCDNVYQNNETSYVNAKYSSRELLNEWKPLKTENSDVKPYSNANAPSKEKQLDLGNSTMCKLSENRTLQNSPSLELHYLGTQSVPIFSKSSNPYIPISECFSGTPKQLENPTTPLNNLDPKFYDMPRSHVNIGLNLTNDQSYSPKITNCTSAVQIMDAQNYTPTYGRSDSDSEGVFTDDDEWTYPMPLRENIDRTARPSDSSMENESYVLTYSQRFSKLPGGSSEKPNNIKCNIEKLSKYRTNLSLDIKQTQKASHASQLSDTENTSPAIGPHDATSIVETCYDIPRSHQLPYHNLEEMFKEKILINNNMNSSKSLTSLDNINDCVKTNTDTSLHKHFYTNAAPNKHEGNVFRYDFIEQVENTSLLETAFRRSVDVTNFISAESDLNNFETKTLPRSLFTQSGKTKPQSSVGPADKAVLLQKSASINQSSIKLIPLSTSITDKPRLQYFDLDLENPPTVNCQSVNICHKTKLESNKKGSLTQNSLKSGVVYNSVDFVKTEAFKRIREERRKENENINADIKIIK
ncbi:protein daughter of sevenless isoform X2 [Eurosta solidaginis]|uniref:protein daughter of sevenless isoform X2 n=1 Tax=Eurosta solidaginis TaxID=178769 RepID=UPI00353098EB